MNVGILDTQFAHGTSLGSGDLKIYPKDFIWSRAPVDSKFTFITESCFHLLDQIPQEKRVAFIIEPMCINSDSYKFVKENQNKFSCILSHNKEFLRQIPNGLYYPFGGCWIEKQDRKIYPKTKLISIIASGKKEAPGHRMRHDVIERFAKEHNIDVYGRGYNPIGSKLTALKDYMYTIVIENESSKGWFTEKLIDAFQTGTIPIYWGAPDIYDYFEHTKGIFNIAFLEEFLKSEKDDPGCLAKYYNKEIADGRIKRMFDLSTQYTCPEDYIFNKYTHLFK